MTCNPDLLPCLELEPARPAIAAVIWLHGLGANGHDFEPIIPELDLPADLGVRFVFPHAPALPVTINGGYIMPAWYDILAMGIRREINETQLHASVLAVSALVDREIGRGIPSTRIVIAGFSQGGAVAYEVALCYPEPLAGLLVLSGYCPTAHALMPHPANRALPVLVCHGSDDSVVPEALGREGVSALQGKGYTPEYRRYAMDHEVCAQEIRDISAWLQERLRM